MRSIFIALICCITAVTSQAQSKEKKQKAPKNITVFTVNKKPVNSAEFIYLYKKNHQKPKEDYSKEKIQEYLDLYVNFKLKVEEARTRGLDTAAAFIKEYNSYKDELRKPYMPDSKLTDSLVKLTYNRMKEEVRASHILVMVKPDALPEDTLKAWNKITEIRSKALAGEDFGALAEANSEDPSAKMNKGDLGYFTAMQMVYPFETAAYETPVGQVSAITRTRFGYHIIKVFDKRAGRGEVEVSHIMLRTGENKDNDKAKNTIFDIYNQLQAGASWIDLCKQYSEDPGSKDAGGLLRPFGVGAMASVPAFEKVAFGLEKPGEISDPFESQYGWHIVRLERKIPLLPYEEMGPALKTKVARDERVQLSKDILQRKLRVQYLFKEKPLVKSKVIALADTTLQKGKWKAPVYSNGAKEILFTIQNKPYYVNNFLTYAAKNQRPTSSDPGKYLDFLYNNYVDASIVQLFENKLIKKNPEYTLLLNEYYEGILLFEIMEKEVWNKASEDSVGQLKYYTDSAAHYQAKERANTILYSASTKDFVDPLLAIVSKGDSVQIKRFISEKKIKIETGKFEQDEKPVLRKVKWAAGVYRSENNGLYYVVWIKDILPPSPKSFDEARSSVISDYQNYLEKEWLVKLKTKYPVKVNEKGKQYIMESLLKD